MYSSRRHARAVEAIRSDWNGCRIPDTPKSNAGFVSEVEAINRGDARPQSVRTFGDFVTNDWMPVILPTLKYATQKHYRYMLDVHLIPAFGKSQLRDLTREDLPRISKSETQ